MGQIHLYGNERQLAKLSELNDPLERINKLIDWEIFRKTIENVVHKHSCLGGRPPYDAILMFKIIILQQWYGLSDGAVEFQINDRISFCRFLGIEFGAKVPDKNTIWDFKEALKEYNIGDQLFDVFNAQLEGKGIITHKGTIVDATFVTVPKRHTTQKDNDHLKKGEELEDLPAKCEARLESGEIKDAENVMAQMDLDARWTKKNDEAYFGYKDHVSCDSESKIIINYSVTDASEHDSQELIGLLDAKDQEVRADSAYVGEAIREAILEKYPDIKLEISSRGNRGKRLTMEELMKNREIAHIRARIEHIFGYMTRFMAGITTRVHGIDRVKREVAMKNLAYNLKRYVFIAG
jgi:IS5 family transposase